MPGWMPGISWMTITAGPVPARYTGWLRPWWVNITRSNPGTFGVVMAAPVVW
jgi:hypothetical protein